MAFEWLDGLILQRIYTSKILALLATPILEDVKSKNKLKHITNCWRKIL